MILLSFFIVMDTVADRAGLYDLQMTLTWSFRVHVFRALVSASSVC